MTSVFFGSDGTRRVWRSRPLGLLLMVAVLVGACTPTAQSPDPAESIPSQEVDPSLLFENVRLQQVDDDNNILWIVHAERVTYSSDRQVAQLENVSGQLYREGEPIYQVQGRSGTLEQEERTIFLEDEVVVVDLRDQVVVRGDRLDWQPQGDRLDIHENVTATHETAHLQAQQMVFLSDVQHLQAIGDVIANIDEPSLQVMTEELLWQIPEQLVLSEVAVQVARYDWLEAPPEAIAPTPDPVQGDDEVANEVDGDNAMQPQDPPPEPRDLQAVTVTDRAAAERIEVNLETQVARLEENVRLALLEPAVDVASHRLDWDLKEQLLTSDVPLRVTHREKQVILSGNRGWMSLPDEVFYLQDGVEVLGQENQAQLTANELTWFIPSETFEAEGNVAYRQVDPPLQLTGPRADGKLEEQTFVVTGGDVVTEILVNSRP
ncbi:LPS export ABC transporter periplasmic protein LptC [Geitlerinema sp. P-1104]|uniref:LPS export ABC transporter periplasmic protein LptC n=1 Tax=Geitlerinema sp. P-1104 TaxID=2546230 RepID=UPI001476FF99|nr:LPS export ABC transporter periplasmic protein LptC [Geitlerinema sp. P-1104]NMG57677.1 LPS export ABC transporter periplasmic protein LptC [Geitlerinema sp. P-1104]